MVGLSIHLLQFDGDKRRLLQRTARKEKLRVVVFHEGFTIFLTHHGGQLLKVANHQELHSPKRSRVGAQATERSIHAVQEVGTHHGDFVDDDEIERTNQLALSIGKSELLIGKSASGDVHAEGQLEKGVNGHSSSIDGSDARGREHHHALVRLFAKLTQKCRLSGASATREKEVGMGVLYNFVRQVALYICHIQCFDAVFFWTKTYLK